MPFIQRKIINGSWKGEPTRFSPWNRTVPGCRASVWRNRKKSLLLLKPTLQVSHGGGLRFETDSSDYAAILNWIKQGAGYGAQAEGGRIERVQVFPSEMVLDQKGEQRLLVTAYDDAGRSEDISHEVRFISQDPHVVKVSEDGLVTAIGTGETTVLVRATGHAVSARVGVVAAVIPNYPQVQPRNLIDKHVFGKLRRFQIPPLRAFQRCGVLTPGFSGYNGDAAPARASSGVPGQS